MCILYSSIEVIMKHIPGYNAANTILLSSTNIKLTKRQKHKKLMQDMMYSVFPLIPFNQVVSLSVLYLTSCNILLIYS